jgi:hypothetical protein
MAKYIADFLSKGYMKTEEVKEVRFEAGCSTVQTGNLFCRSFDFGDKGQQMVIVRTYPDEGYASLSTSSFAFIGLGDEWRPVSGMDGMTALATTYIPMDGINEKGLCVADLIELDGGAWDGLTFDQLRERYPDSFGPHARGGCSPDGESDADGLVRMCRALDLISENTQSCAAIVAHSGVNRLLLCHLAGLPLTEKKRMGQDYAAVSVLSYEEGVWFIQEHHLRTRK